MEEVVFEDNSGSPNDKICQSEICQSEIARLKHRMKLLQSNVDMLEEFAQSAEEEISQLKTQLNSKTYECKSLQSKLAIKSRQCEFEMDSEEHLKEIPCSTEKEVHQLKLKDKESTEEIKSLEAVIKDLRIQIETLQDDQTLKDAERLEQEPEAADTHLEQTTLSEESSQAASDSEKTPLLVKVMYGLGALFAVGSVVYAASKVFTKQ